VCDPQWAINSHAIGFLADACAPDADDDAVIEAGGRHGPVEVAALCEVWPPEFRLPIEIQEAAHRVADGLSREIEERL
jgi:hypothetical protein